MFKQLIGALFGNNHKSLITNHENKIQDYETKIEDMEKVNKKIQQEYDLSLKKIKANNKKIRELENLLEDLTLQLQVNNPINLTSISKPAVQEKTKKLDQIDLLKQLLKEEKIDECCKAANKLVQQANPNDYSLEGIRNLAEFLKLVFMNDLKTSPAVTGLYAACTDIMHLFYKKEPIKHFLAANETKVNQRIIGSKSANLIANLAALYFNHHEQKHDAFLTKALNKHMTLVDMHSDHFIKYFGLVFI